MERDSELLNKKKTVQISVIDKDGKEHPIDVETEMVPVNHEISYKTENEWWSKDPETGKVYAPIPEHYALHFQELQARKESGPPLTEDENRIYEALKVVLQELPVFAADNAYNTQPDASSLESVEHETKKRTNRTRKKDYVDPSLTKHISLIIDQEYESGLSLRKSGNAYLKPLVSTDGLNYNPDTGKLSFAGLPASEATLEEINRGKVVEIGEFDLPLLKLFYSIILSDFRESFSTNHEVNESFAIYLPDLAELMGKGRNISAEDTILLRNKVGAFQTLYGVIRDPKYPKRIGSALPLLVSLGYDDTTNTIRFSSPYMLRLIQTLYDVTVRRSKLRLKKMNEPEKFLISEHADIINTSITKERNKRSVEIVFAIVTMIEQSKDENVFISVQEIFDRSPQLADALKNTIRTSNKNTLLKRAFSKAYELLEKQTTLKERYPNMVFSEEFLGIPTVSTLKDMQLHFIKKK